MPTATAWPMSQSPWYVGGPRGGNMEHQPSGLVWGLDNWIYTTYNSYRLRWNGKETAVAQGAHRVQRRPVGPRAG